MKRPGSLVLVVAGVGAAAAAVLARRGPVPRRRPGTLGETERDIDAAFDDAEAQDAVLVVDDADELFDRASGTDDQDPD